MAMATKTTSRAMVRKHVCEQVVGDDQIGGEFKIAVETRVYHG